MKIKALRNDYKRGLFFRILPEKVLKEYLVKIRIIRTGFWSKDMFFKLLVNGKPYRGTQQCGKLAKLNFCYDFAWTYFKNNWLKVNYLKNKLQNQYIIKERKSSNADICKIKGERLPPSFPCRGKYYYYIIYLSELLKLCIFYKCV